MRKVKLFSGCAVAFNVLGIWISLGGMVIGTASADLSCVIWAALFGALCAYGARGNMKFYREACDFEAWVATATLDELMAEIAKLDTKRAAK